MLGHAKIPQKWGNATRHLAISRARDHTLTKKVKLRQRGTIDIYSLRAALLYRSISQSHIANARPHNQRRTLHTPDTAQLTGPVTCGVRAPLARRDRDTRAHTATARTRTHEGAPSQSHMQSLSCRHTHAHAASSHSPTRVRARVPQRQNEDPAKVT